jgi:hypothetical protein
MFCLTISRLHHTVIISLHEELLFLVCSLGDIAGKLMLSPDLEVSMPVVLLVVVLQANTYACNTLKLN